MVSVPTALSIRTKTTLMKRHRKPKDAIMGITRSAIRRLVRRGGIMRIKKDIYEQIRGVIKAKISEMLRIVVGVLDSSRAHRYERKMINTRDIVYALQKIGHTMYGFGDV